MFNVTTMDDELRGPMPGTMKIEPTQKNSLTGKIGDSYDSLTIERPPFTENYELVVRDGKTGFVFFNIEGHEYDYDAGENSLQIQNGRLKVSKAYATELGRDSFAGTVVGRVSVDAKMRAIEVI